MKKYIFMAVAGMLALSSCSSDDNEQTPQNAPRQMTFTAGFGDGTQTRTTLNADKSVSFDANDAISIFSENNTNVQFTTTEGGARAEFTGTAVAGDATYYAVYPYKDSYTFRGGIVSGVTIEFSQPVNTSDGETWSKNSVISYATATGSDLVFHNACALLKITNNTVWGTDIHISADQPLAGAFDLDTSTGALTVLYGETLVTTTIPDNATVYLAIAPGEYTNFTAAKSTMMEDQGEWYSKTKASVTFQAGKIYDLGTTSSWMPQQAGDVTWNSTNVFNDTHEHDMLNFFGTNPLTYEEITISYNGSDSPSMFQPYNGEGKAVLQCSGSQGAEFTFTAPSGKKFTKIEIINNGFLNFTEYGDWTKSGLNTIVWSGTAANEVTLGGSNDTLANDLNSILFWLEDAD